MLTQLVFADHLHSLLQQAGVDHSGHSFQIGAATTVAANCCSDATIPLLGRWQSDEFFFPSCSPSPTKASPVVFCIDIYIFPQFCPHSLRIITSHVHIIIHFLHNYESDLPFRGKYHITVIPQEETAR